MDSDELCDLNNSLSGSHGDIHICTTLIEIEERCYDLVVSREGLFELLSNIQKIIDSSTKSNVEGVEWVASDVSKSHALVTYTAVLIQFDELAEPIRGQFTRALVDMVFRSVVKRRDYVNSFLRRTACECLNELELAFPSEVAEALQLTPWLASQSVTTPAIVEAVQEEQLMCFENYAKLLMTCCQSGPSNDKALMKIVSLLLDSVESSSVWVRAYVATRFPVLVVRMQAPDWTFGVVYHHFSRFLDSMHAFQLHAFLVVSRPFFHEWDSQLLDRVVARIYGIVLSQSASVPVRQLATYWLSDLMENEFLKSAVFAKKHLLVPRVRSEPSQLVEVKLQALLRYASTDRSIPRKIVAAVQTVTPIGAIFTFLVRILNNFSILFDDELFEIPRFLTEMLQASPRVNPSVIALCESIQSQKVKRRMLESFGSFLFQVQPPSRTVTYFPLLAYLACQHELESVIVVSALSRFVDTTDPVSWSDGLKILETCRLLVLTHTDANIQSILRRLADVGSVDVAERALLLSRFIACEDRHVFLVPTSCLSGHQNSGEAKEEREGATASSSQVSTPRGPPVRLDRNLTNRESLGLSDGHWGCYTSDGVVLPFTLTCDSLCEELFGIELSFSASAHHDPFRSVTVPYLKARTVGGEIERGFPYEYSVLLRLRPQQPEPATFTVQIEFTDKLGLRHSWQLESFKVALEDMFMPANDAGQVWREKWRNPFAKLLPIRRDTVERLIATRLGPFVLTEALTELPDVPEFDFTHELLMHGVRGSDNSSSCIEEKAVIISLPPCYHLMMRFVMGARSTVVWIDTDRVEVLSLLDEFFAPWSSSRSLA